MRFCKARYGSTFSLDVLGRHVVVITDPEDVRCVFAGSANQFHAGEGNTALRPLVGDHSLLLLDEREHLRHRRLMAPSLSGASLRAYRDLVKRVATGEVATWPSGRVRLVKHTQAITLEIILRVVIGASDPEKLQTMRRLILRLTEASPITLAGALSPFLLRRVWPWMRFRRDMEELDAVLYSEIRSCRETSDKHERNDVLTRLVGEYGDESPAAAREGLSDSEIRDELITLILAGHDTTSLGLAWTLHELMRSPESMRRAVEAARATTDSADEYLAACVKESLRLRPVFGEVARYVTIPTRIGRWTHPAGTVLVPSIDLVHHNRIHYADADAYRPERFLNGTPPANAWVPFGGGARRCIGAGFALMESVEILRAILREQSLSPVSICPEKVRTRHITLAPQRGAEAFVARAN